MALIPCRSCANHVSTDAASCPHCGSATPGTSVLSTSALLLGLTVAAWGCPAVQPLYGATVTDSVDGETSETGDTGAEER